MCGSERKHEGGVFLDRDGVLNSLMRMSDGRRRPPWSETELELLPGAVEASELLSAAGFPLIVVTNQPDVGNGFFSVADAHSINARLLAEIPTLRKVYSCHHFQSDECDCRKPKPGMLIKAAREWKLDLSQSWLVGDRWVDVLAGERAGCRTVLVEHPYSWSATSAGSPPDDLMPTAVAEDVLRAAQFIVKFGFSRK